MCNRKNLQNGNAFILGVSGSGKSFIAKEELTFVALSTDDDILVVDPEREYEPLIRSLNAETGKTVRGSRIWQLPDLYGKNTVQLNG